MTMVCADGCFLFVLQQRDKTQQRSGKFVDDQCLTLKVALSKGTQPRQDKRSTDIQLSLWTFKLETWHLACVDDSNCLLLYAQAFLGKGR